MHILRKIYPKKGIIYYVDQTTFIEEYNWFTQYIDIPKDKNIMTNNY